MAIDAIEHLDGHTQKARSLPFIDTCLHQPRRCRVAQGVRADLADQARPTHRRLERRLHRAHGLHVPFDEIIPDDALRVPAPKMRQ